MKIYNRSDLTSQVKDGYLFVDTNALVVGLSHPEIINSVVDEGCTILTIPSAVFEFSRTDNIEVYNKRIEFLGKYVTPYSIERHLDEFKDLVLVLHREARNMSYTDLLLFCCLYKFPKSFLLTENHKDFPLSILDRVSVITLDADNSQIRNLGLYRFSQDKYEKAAGKIIKEYSKPK